VVAAGHGSGEVSMWVPNMGKPAVDLLAHPSQKINAIAFHPQGQYMATAGVDSRLRIWDLRTYKKLHDYFVPSQAFSLDFSQKGLLAVSHGHETLIWRDVVGEEKQKQPYMKHRVILKEKRS